MLPPVVAGGPLVGGLKGAWFAMAALMQGGAGGCWQYKITAGTLLLLLSVCSGLAAARFGDLRSCAVW